MKDVDLTDLDLFAHGFPHDVFERHRREAPVYWHEPTPHTPGGEGFWSVATYHDTLEVLDHPRDYSSERGGDREHGGTLLLDLPVAGVVLNMMDDPRHARIRRLVSKGLTPRTVRRLEEDLRRRALALLDGLGGATIDLVADLTAEVPMQAVCFLLGVPEADRHRLFECVEHVFDFRDEHDYFAFTPEQTEALGWMADYGAALIADKRSHPTDDMLSVAAHARLDDVEPPSLTDDELLSFFSLLFSAGSETTRNALAGGLLALMERPASLARLWADPSLIGTAVEEMLRWTTPSSSKRRTATRELALHGHRIRPGDKVVVWEASANRDDAVFAHSMELDLARDPNPHVAFGHGIHYCLGAHLARLEMRVVLEELVAGFRTVELAGDVEWARSNRHTGIRRLPVRMVGR